MAKFSKERFMMSLLERLRFDMERCFPYDKESQEITKELLYKFAWKVKDAEDEDGDEAEN